MSKKQWYGDKKAIYVDPQDHAWLKGLGTKDESFAQVVKRIRKLLAARGIQP